MDQARAPLDADLEAYIERSASFYPDDATDLSIAEQRRVYDRLCEAFRVSRPTGVAVRDLTAGGVPCRLYEAGAPFVTVIYFHGGGFVLGGLDSHDDICAEIAAITGYRVLSVDYRLAPEHVHPAPFEDGFAVLRWALERFDGPLVLAGDSAGGNIAAALAHANRDKRQRIVGQLLIYPGLGGDADQGSYLENADAPGLTRADIAYYMKIRCAGAVPKDDPTFAPLSDPDFSRLPPTVIFTADCDPIRDDGQHYAARITAAGGRAHWINEPGLIHGYLRARHSVTRAGASFERILDALQCLGEEAWPF
ncbi:esterase [Thalassococcus sp. S3]|nr:alpha/beta hydrolase [Thalassococcus sp. S3]QBF31101.1 esterase [Thalassococcus sp. S3]